jgi:cytochrome c oxidase subunit 2
VKGSRPLLATVWVVTLTVALAACSGDSPSTLDPAGSEARDIAGVWWLMFGLAAAVYVVVAGFILVGALRGRGSDGGRPSRISDNWFVVVGGVVVPLVILLVIAVVTVTTTRALRRPDATALRVDVAGERWWWGVRYPEYGITSANEIRLPAGQPVSLRLTSDNVIHSFWVPELAGKLDTIPGQPNELTFTPEEPGTYLGLCAEYCGLQHANMKVRVIVQTPGAFQRWVAAHRAPPSTPATEEEVRGRLVFERSSCAGCHTIAGTEARGTVGPDLTDVGSRLTIGAGVAENTEGNLAGWIADPRSLKRGVLMPPGNLSPDDLRAVVAYLRSLQ